MSKIPLIKLTLNLETRHKKLNILISLLLYAVFTLFTYSILVTESKLLMTIYALVVLASPILYFIDYKIYLKFNDIFFIQKDDNYTTNEIIYVDIESVDVKNIIYNDDEGTECLAYIIESKSGEILTSIPLTHINVKMFKRLLREIKFRNPEVKVTKEVRNCIYQIG